jgi:hypothetical protein
MEHGRIEERQMKEPAELAVDLWLCAQLATRYNNVLDEPIPDDLLRQLDIQHGDTKATS